MTRPSASVAIGSAVLIAITAHSEVQRTVADGGSVLTRLEHDATERAMWSHLEDINDGSSLRRLWVTLNDTECPLRITDMTFLTEGRSGNIFFKVGGTMRPSVPLSAYEVRFLLFDIFDSLLTTFTIREVNDHDIDAQIPLAATWGVGRSDVEVFLTVVAYVAQARTQDGAVWRYDKNEVAYSILDMGLASDLTSTERTGDTE